MSRIIKFRAWDKEDKKMLDWGDIACLPFGSHTLLYSKKDYFIPMQFTGLTDKNGKEIYEGDIVKAKTEGNFFIGRIYWNSACYYIKKNNDGIYLSVIPDIEVIGNIYSNPELLKEGEL